MITRHLRLCVIALQLPLAWGLTTTPNTGDQEQGFLFSFPLPSLPNSLTLPLIPACPNSLTISPLSTTSNPATSDPVAPYTMTMLVHEQLMDGANNSYERIYSRTMDVGDMSVQRNFAVPWMNGTQMIACMWAANGVSGGCQDLMTVVQGPGSPEAFANATSACRTPNSMGSWVTPPGNTLNVQVSSASGNLASNGWPASCSDISITPLNGTAPFTLLVAPAFHPPVNITSPDLSPINYTVKLTHGQAFMLGLYDSAGNSFAFGPLHAGHAEDVTCLATLTGQSLGQVTGPQFSVGALAGGVAGAFVLGALGALALGWCLWRNKRPSRQVRSLTKEVSTYSSQTFDSQELLDPYADPRPASYRIPSNHSSTYGKHTDPTDPFSPLPYDATATGTPGTLYDPVEYPLTPTAGRNWRKSAGEGYANPFDRPASLGYSDEFGGSTIPPDGTPRDVATYPGAGGKRHSSGAGRASNGSPPQPLRAPWGQALHRDSSRDSLPNDSKGETDRHRSLSPNRPRNVYVVHSDGGNGDLHIRLPEGGANVIELPPDYIPDPRGSGAGESRTDSRGSLGRSRSERERMEAAYLDFGERDSRREYSTRDSRGSGRTEVSMSPEELRARAEAAMAEKERMERVYGGQRRNESG